MGNGQGDSRQRGTYGGKKRKPTEKGGSRKEQPGGEMKTTRRDDMCMQKMISLDP